MANKKNIIRQYFTLNLTKNERRVTLCVSSPQNLENAFGPPVDIRRLCTLRIIGGWGRYFVLFRASKSQNEIRGLCISVQKAKLSNLSLVNSLTFVRKCNIKSLHK